MVHWLFVMKSGRPGQFENFEFSRRSLNKLIALCSIAGPRLWHIITNHTNSPITYILNQRFQFNSIFDGRCSVCVTHSVFFCSEGYWIAHNPFLSSHSDTFHRFIPTYLIKCLFWPIFHVQLHTINSSLFLFTSCCIIFFTLDLQEQHFNLYITKLR